MTFIESKYLGKLRTEARHLDSGTVFVTDAPKDNNGEGQSFSPTDSVAMALGSCMVTIMGILANRENIDLTGLTWKTQKIMQSNPRKISEIKIEFFLENNQLSPEQKEKLKRAALTCPVALSLHPDLVQNITFYF